MGFVLNISGEKMVWRCLLELIFEICINFEFDLLISLWQLFLVVRSKKKLKTFQLRDELLKLSWSYFFMENMLKWIQSILISHCSEHSFRLKRVIYFRDKLPKESWDDHAVEIDCVLAKIWCLIIIGTSIFSHFDSEFIIIKYWTKLNTFKIKDFHIKITLWHF